jgi:hypothetical protein
MVLTEEWPACALKPVWRLKNNPKPPNTIKYEINKPFAIILLQATRKGINWKTEGTLERAVVTLETERIKGSKP